MADKSNLVFNLEEIKKKAQQSMEDGALTKDYPLPVDKACELLNQALATEILCVLRYRHHQVIAKGINSAEVAAEFEEHALNESQHMMMLAERINQLGGDPDFNPATIRERTATDYGTRQDLIGMIKEDLIAERIVISIYRQMIEWFGHDDPTTRRILESILEDEEEHAEELADLIQQNQ